MEFRVDNFQRPRNETLATNRLGNGKWRRLAISMAVHELDVKKKVSKL